MSDTDLSPDDHRAQVYVAAAESSTDEVRCYYELPDDLVRRIWQTAVGPPSENETLAFDQVLEWVLTNFADYVRLNEEFRASLQRLTGEIGG